ncbi:MAG: hypothetical protein ABW022_04900 [Actinoplanes sp.]
MPIAKETLKIGFTVVANAGNYVTKDAVKRYGWEDKVTDGDDLTAGQPDKDALAPKGKPQKGSSVIPLATTTVTVLRDTDLDAEPYSGPPTMSEVASGVRAVISRPTGRNTGQEQLGGGEQAVWDFELVMDLTVIDYRDNVRDDSTGIVYQVVWAHMYHGDHTEAGLRLVQGDV